MVGRNTRTLLLIIVSKRGESACHAISLKESASSGRKPPRLARQMKLNVQTVKVPFARKPPPSRRAIHHPTDRWSRLLYCGSYRVVFQITASGGTFAR